MPHATLLALMLGVFLAGRVVAAPIRAGSEFQINTYSGDQVGPDVCVDADGDFVVAWASFPGGIRGRRFDGAGMPLADEFIVSASPFLGRVGIACRADGGFVVTWDDGADVFGRRYAPSGVPLGLPFMVNAFTTGRQAESTVAVKASGEFVVAW